MFKRKKNKKKQKKIKSHVRICPRCNSTDVSTDFSNPGIVGTGLVNSAFRCNNCNYKEFFFPEIHKNHIPAIKKVKKL